MGGVSIRCRGGSICDEETCSFSVHFRSSFGVHFLRLVSYGFDVFLSS